MLAMEENVYQTELTLVNFLERSALVFPGETTAVHGNRRYSYRKLVERVNRLVSALHTAGLLKQDRKGFL